MKQREVSVCATHLFRCYHRLCVIKPVRESVSWALHWSLYNTNFGLQKELPSVGKGVTFTQRTHMSSPISKNVGQYENQHCS